jgi:signal transduction histidine kinase
VTGSGAITPPRRRFVEWSESIDPTLRRSLQWPLGWVVAALGYALLLWFVAHAPSMRGFFRVEPFPVIGLELLALVFTLLAYHREGQGLFTSGQRAACMLVIAFLFQLVLSATVSFSQPPGTYVFAALPLLAMWLHVPAIGGSWQHPFPLVAHGLGMAVGLALRPDPAHVAVFATVIPLGVAGSLLSGTLLAELSGQRAALSRHRSAIRAQVLATRAEEVDRLSDTLRRATTLRNEGESARQVALRAARAIGDGVHEGAPAPTIRASLAALDEALRRLARSAEETRSLGRCSPPSSEGAIPVEVYPRVREALAELVTQFPHASITCRASSPRAESVRAAVGGGDEGLRRILQIGVTNACEGDGTRGASRVEVLVTEEPQLRLVTLEVRDDGPGFPRALLDGPIEAFATTKPGASGLGLYTAERLARAGGGFLRRDNGAGGGARLTIFLPSAVSA